MTENPSPEVLVREWMIHRIAKELDVSPDTIDTSKKFEEFGIGSMNLVGIAGELAESIGEDLSLDVFFIYDNIDDLAEHIGSSAQESPGQQQQAPTNIDRFRRTQDGDLLQALQPHGESTPIFLVHGLTGNAVGTYRHLPEHLGDNQPVFGIRQPKDAPDSIEELAARYIDVIRTVQRKGPFRLAGYCFGGMVAYEIARQLEQFGQTTEQLVIFDPPPPRLCSPLPWPARLRSWAGHLTRSTTFLTSQMARGRKKAFLHASNSAAKCVGRLKQRIAPRKLAGIEAAAGAYAEVNRELVRHNLATLATYEPKPYSGPLQLVMSSGLSTYRALSPRKWRQLNAAVDTAWVPSYHDDMLMSGGARRATEFLSRGRATSTSADRIPG